MRCSDSRAIASRVMDLYVLFEEIPSGGIDVEIGFDEFLNY